MASYALKNGCKNCVVIVEAGDDYSAGFGNYFSEAMIAGGAKCKHRHLPERRDRLLHHHGKHQG